MSRPALVMEKVDGTNISELFGLICELAKFEKLDLPDHSAMERLEEHVNQENPYFEAYLARYEGKAIAYIIYYFSYSSFKAKPSLFLEDIFVKEELRGKGFGKDLFLFCVKKAHEKGCGRMEWSALNWNKRAIDFYLDMGARPLSEWTFYRMDEVTIAKLMKMD